MTPTSGNCKPKRKGRHELYGHSSGASLALEAAAQLDGGLEAIAPTLAYDHTGILGPDRAVPARRAARVPTPALAMYGDASFPFMRDTAETLSRAMPHGDLRSFEGQDHNVDAAVLGPVLIEFFGA